MKIMVFSANSPLKSKQKPPAAHQGTTSRTESLYKTIMPLTLISTRISTIDKNFKLVMCGIHNSCTHVSKTIRTSLRG